MSDPFSRTKCALCQFDGAPHDVLINAAEDDNGDPVLVCDSQANCAERISERASLLPYVLGADMDDAPEDACVGCGESFDFERGHICLDDRSEPCGETP